MMMPPAMRKTTSAMRMLSSPTTSGTAAARAAIHSSEVKSWVKFDGSARTITPSIVRL